MVLALTYFLCLLLLLLPFSTTAQTYTNITLGSSLTALNDNSSWKSPSGDFAFGFRQIRTGNFLLALWFDKIPEKTITWSANGETLVQKGSKIQLTQNGYLVLTDPQGQKIWAANPTAAGVAYAAVLDVGNLVLVSNDSVILWQSFDHPTDTILPTQVLNLGTKLVARFSENNFSSGRFELPFQNDGNLVLYTRAFPLDSVYGAYWATGTDGSGYQTIFRPEGSIEVIGKTGKVLSTVSSSAASTEDFYQRAIIENDGVFRQYIYPIAGGGSRTVNWSQAWSSLTAIPSDICMSITLSTGSGACGFNSLCRLIGQRPKCECPPGYTFSDPNDKLDGCRPTFVPQNCNGKPERSNLFDIVEMPDTDWPLSDYELLQPVTEEWCRGACLDDCQCAVAIFRNGNCWKKKVPLSNGRINPSVGGKALIKVGKNVSVSESTIVGLWKEKKKD
ncbi:G-type lectin S-receptor-like serine/threonine-protein kinase LECRK3 [Malania oleifera]|uniref:G-type lectin S-receptor-like serine/threonine-protein kinase LECRK3 n=1 Tax=Malania oleifera TaxID=397392 RepID=UPI0025AE38BA|nr:G-type lectin S-receptor-like serine/threonine-protein kinase LECRK3 [Malania oleifera]XP_057953545.1 G-type lectin S-receptor-like serine/threonine-protein kinase LECRK3 [Malania oleifera]XP_057953546.1 G-type lectin S-receptor-like serine/threonine-protein kinase LECRK3 [Malania oleifera]